MSNSRCLLPVLLLCADFTACDRSEPAGRVTARPTHVLLAYPQSVPLELSWQPLRALDRRHGRPVAFVHLVIPGERKNVVWRTFDHALPGPWRAGQPQSEEIELYQSALAEPVPPGRYTLSLGLYDESWGYRWPLATAGPEVAKREYQIAEVEVIGPDPSAPKFTFADGWKPAEALSTKQVLARRCLSGPASLRVEEIRAPGEVRLQFTVPEARRASLAVTTTCETARNEMLAAGRPWVGVRVTSPTASGSCEIRLDPGAAPPALVSPAPAVATCLDVLAWRPDTAGPR